MSRREGSKISQLKELKIRLTQKEGELRVIEERMKTSDLGSREFCELISARNNSIAFVNSIKRQLENLKNCGNRLGVLDTMPDPTPN